MSQVFQLPKAVPIVNGAVSPGAVLYFYQTGTTTPINVYTDADLTIAHGTSVTADAAGVFAPIYIDPFIEYKVTLKDSGGSTIYTVDPANVSSSIYPQTDAETTAAVTPTDTAVPSHDKVGYVLASRYGFSESATGSANYTALVNAHAVADQANVKLVIPDGTYSYTPSAAINLAVPMEGEGMPVLTCNMSAYSGVVFRMIGSTYIKNLYLNRSGTLQGTAIYQAPVTATDFTGYQVLERVWAIGFARGLNIGNVFENTYKNCRFNDGTTGIYCVPDGGTGNGYVTTLHFDSCEVRGNAQNYLFTSTLQSRGVTFTNCTTEDPTTTASTFTKIRGLHFREMYAEGSSSIKGLILNDCSASIDGIYLNGTAGITLGTNTEARIKGLRIGTSTDLLTGGDSTQVVYIEDSQFHTSGNSLSYLRLTMVNTYINGTWYEQYNGPRSSFTGTLTGCTTSPTATITYSVSNDIVTVLIPALTATSNATSCTITGVPAAIRPATTQYLPSTIVQDNGASTSGVVQVNTSGVITFFVGVNASGFTSSGTKGVGVAIALSWKLAA